MAKGIAPRVRLDYHKPVVGQPLIRRAGALALGLGLVLVVIGGGIATRARAAEPKFMGVDIVPYHGNFVVTSTVNVRAQPSGNAERLGRFEEDQIIEVVGRIKGGDWYAVVNQGKPVGFVYGKAVLPLIDGQLSSPIRGVAKPAAGPPCRYEIRFSGHSKVEGEPARIADYIAELHCGTHGDDFRLPAPMFMTETPYNLRHGDRVFQINVDLLAEALGSTDVEMTFSTIFLFDLDKGVVSFDSISDKGFARSGTKDLSRPATGPAAAVRAALDMALQVWNEKLWKTAKANAG